MRAVYFSYDLDEAAVLNLVLQRAGFAPQQIHEIARLSETIIERPPDFILAAFGREHPASREWVESVRAETTAPLVVIGEPIPEEQQVRLLESGVDIFLARPYSIMILIAQIRAVMRRSAGLPAFGLPVLTQPGVMVDPATARSRWKRVRSSA